MELLKYPRTQHIQGSKFQNGDEDLSAVPFGAIASRYVVVEEKLDGANCAISFGDDAELLLQSRGHYLLGGAREKHFNLFKQWARIHVDSLYSRLGTKYVCYGEWLFAKHTVFYDALPHYFFEFDIYDRELGTFLSTANRAQILQGMNIAAVPVLFAGKLASEREMKSLLGPSAFISSTHIDNLRNQSRKFDLSEEQVMKETDASGLMEGLYIKVEEDGIVKQRYKYIRAGFLSSVFQSESHWLNRPILPNLLQDGVSLHE